MIISPYPGLRSFLREEEEIFFGREEHVDVILEKLSNSRFLAVTGPSGCGKSSLVKAGMLPALELGFLAEAGEEWRIATIHPGNRPMRNLAMSLIEDSALGQEKETDEDSTAAFLLSTLQRGPLGLIEALTRNLLPADINLLILVDQFEEIFRYRQQDIDEAEAFVDLLLASSKQKEFPIYVVITMRSEFLGDCALFSGLPEAINESQFLTPRLTREQRRGAIVGPAKIFGGNIESALVNRLLNDMGASPDQLPLMQHALMRMWISKKGAEDVLLTLKDYEIIGGLEHALSNHADDAFENELSEDQKFIAKRVFCCLCELSDGQRDSRRPVKLSELAAVAGTEPEKVKKVINVFRQTGRSFLSPPVNVSLTPETIIDISHESLIRQWKRLNEWVQEEALSADTYRHLEQTARQWKQEKAALWSTPNLENALEWKKNHDPTPEWTERYGGDFKLAMNFLEESEKEWEQEKNKEKRALILSVIGMFVAICLALWGFWGWMESNRLKDAEYKVRIERACDLYNSKILQASLLARLEEYSEASSLLKQLEKEVDLNNISNDRRNLRNLIAWYTDLMGGKATKIIPDAKIPLFNVSVTSDSRQVAVGGGNKVLVFDTDTGDKTDIDESLEYVSEVVFGPSGLWLAVSDWDDRIIIWSMGNGKNMHEWSTNSNAKALAVSSNGKLLASGGSDGNVTLWDTKTGKRINTFKAHDTDIVGLAFHPNNKWLASASSSITRIWDIETGKRLHDHDLKGHTLPINVIAFSPDGYLLATGSADKTIRLWYTISGKVSNTLFGHKDQINGITFFSNKSDTFLVSASSDSTIRVWDMDSGVTLKVFQGHTAEATGVAASKEYIFSVAKDGALQQWNMTQKYIRMKNIDREPLSCAITPDGTKVAVGFDRGNLQLYDLATANLLWEKKEAHTTSIKRLDISFDSQFIVSAGWNNTVKLWRIYNNQLQLITTWKHESGVNDVTFAPDGKLIASAGLDGKIGLFEIDKQEGHFYMAHDKEIYSVDFDASGQFLLSAGDDGKIKKWGMKTWPPDLKQELKGRVTWGVFGSDDTTLTSVGQNNNFQHIVKIWKDGKHTEEKTFLGHEGTILRIIISPDGNQAATVSADATVRFWDFVNENELFTLRLPAKKSAPHPVEDFDFKCTPGGECWICVPLTCGKLVIYNLGRIYNYK